MRAQDQHDIRVAVYSRVSTDMQAEHGYSLGTQERLCREYCDREFGPDGYSLQVFEEPGRSGATKIRQLARKGDKVRPVLSDLVDQIEAGFFTHLVTYEVSRVAREDYLWHMIRHAVLKPNSVSLRIVCGNLNMDNENDALTADMQELLGTRERLMIRRRILDAHESRRQAGYWPNGAPPWGWKWQDLDEVARGDRRNIVPDPERAPYVEFMVDKLLNEGWGCRRIAAEMQNTGVLSGRKNRKWTTMSVYRIVTNHGQAGYIRLKDGTLKKARHHEQRFYDFGTYERILQTLSGRNTPKTRTLSDEDFPLLGVLHCGHCGKRMYAYRGGTADNRFYRCGSSELGEGRECPGVMKKAELIEPHVYSAIADFASSPLMSRLVGEEAEKLLAARQGQLADEIEQRDNELAALDNKLQNWAEAFTEGKMSEVQFHKVSAAWQKQYDQLVESKSDLESRLENGSADRQTIARIRAALHDFAKTFESLPVSRQREILLELLDRLTLERGDDALILRLKIRFLPEMEYHIPTFKDGPDSGIEALTDRQLALLKLLDDGLKLTQIAQQWQVVKSSTRSTLYAAKEKTAIADTDHLVEAARPYFEAALPRLPLQGRMLPQRDPSKLTPRQRQVLSRVAAGRVYRQIGNELGISLSTVGVAMHAIREKLHVESTREAIEWWNEQAHGGITT